MLKKIKDRKKALILSVNKDIENDLCMILSSHGYSPDIVENYNKAVEKIIYFKPSLLIADTELLPEFPIQMMEVFQKARNTPAFLIFGTAKIKDKLNKYMEFTDGVLRIPFAEDNINYKIKRAVNNKEIAQDNQYYLGMLLILKLIAPILLLLIFVLTAMG